MIHKAKSFFSLCSEPIKRYLFHFSAFAGLFAGTARCPVCGQTLCPAGTTGLGLLAALLAFITSRLNKKHRQYKTEDQRRKNNNGFWFDNTLIHEKKFEIEHGAGQQKGHLCRKIPSAQRFHRHTD